METAMAYNYPKGVTPEEVWAILRDIAAQQKETDRILKETDQIVKETAERQKETEQQMKETDRRMGFLYNRFGELAEHLVAPGIEEKFNALGYEFSAAAFNGCEIRDQKGNVTAQIDILLENGNCIMAVEVKSKPKMQDIEHHIKRLEILRQYRNKNNDHRKIYGAIAGAVFGKAEKQECIETGFYAIEQTGDTMQIDVPDGFAPKEW